MEKEGTRLKFYALVVRHGPEVLARCAKFMENTGGAKASSRHDSLPSIPTMPTKLFTLPRRRLKEIPTVLPRRTRGHYLLLRSFDTGEEETFTAANEPTSEAEWCALAFPAPNTALAAAAAATAARVTRRNRNATYPPSTAACWASERPGET